MPLPLGVGIWLYFQLSFEPLPHLVAVLAMGVVVVLGLAVWCRRQGWSVMWLWLALALMGLGFVAASWRTHQVAAPVVAQSTYPMWIEGLVVDRDPPTGRGMRITLDRPELAEWGPAGWPARVRVSLKPSESEALGDRVRVRAILLPPPGPDFTGGYHFARRAWFERLGAVGFSISPPEVMAPVRTDLTARLARWRGQLATRLTSQVPGTPGCVLAALVVGDKTCIPAGTAEAWRLSGLAHLLAISGLHMGLVAGFLFFAVRLGLVLVPGLAERVPIKKWAAVIALLGAGVYLLISGADPPARRAFLMVLVATVAILADRRAISHRSLAVAASLILLLTPEDLLGASFQLSYAATLALVAAYEVWQARSPMRDLAAQTWPLRAVRLMGMALGGVIMASFVAGLATAPLAVQHFNRLTSFGVLANAVAAPVASYWVMPSLAAAVIVDTIPGLGILAEGLQTVAGQGVEVINAVAQMVAGWPMAVHLWPSGPDGVPMMVLLGLMTVALVPSWPRWLGVLVVGAAMMVGPLSAKPLAWVAADARMVVMAPSGTSDDAAVIPAHLDKARDFPVNGWLRRHAYVEVADDDEGATATPAFQAFGCDGLGCVSPPGAALRLAISHHPSSLHEDCHQADVIITTYGLDRDHYSAPLRLGSAGRGDETNPVSPDTKPVSGKVMANTSSPPDTRLRWPGCHAQVVDQGLLARSGGLQIWPGRAKGQVRLTPALDLRTLKPWTPPRS